MDAAKAALDGATGIFLSGGDQRRQTCGAGIANINDQVHRVRKGHDHPQHRQHDGQDGDVWRVSCKPSEGPALAEQADAEAHLFDWAGGLLWLRTASGTDLRAKLGTYDGHATLIRADATTKERLGVFQPETAGVARLTAGLRARFDPKGLFNAGLMETAA